MIVSAGLLPAAFIGFGVARFSLLALVFFVLQPWAERPIWVRGLGYGAFLTGLVAVLYTEPPPGTDPFGAANLLWLGADARPLLPFGLVVASLARTTTRSPPRPTRPADPPDGVRRRRPQAGENRIDEGFRSRHTGDRTRSECGCGARCI